MGSEYDRDRETERQTEKQRKIENQYDRKTVQVYAWKVYERWFASEEKCTKANVLALVLLDGLVNDARKIPYVRLHTGKASILVVKLILGETKLRAALGNIQSEANNALVQGWPLQDMLDQLVDDIGYALHELYELNGEPRDHSVPRFVYCLSVFLSLYLYVSLSLYHSHIFQVGPSCVLSLWYSGGPSADHRMVHRPSKQARNTEERQWRSENCLGGQ